MVAGAISGHYFSKLNKDSLSHKITDRSLLTHDILFRDSYSSRFSLKRQHG